MRPGAVPITSRSSSAKQTSKPKSVIQILLVPLFGREEADAATDMTTQAAEKNDLEDPFLRVCFEAELKAATNNLDAPWKEYDHQLFDHHIRQNSVIFKAFRILLTKPYDSNVLPMIYIVFLLTQNIIDCLDHLGCVNHSEHMKSCIPWKEMVQFLNEDVEPRGCYEEGILPEDNYIGQLLPFVKRFNHGKHNEEQKSELFNMIRYSRIRQIALEIVQKSGCIVFSGGRRKHLFS